MAQLVLRAETNIYDFSAIGNGETDDTDAFNDALSEVDFGTGTPAITIVLPPGEFLISSTVQIRRKNVRLVGSGVGNPFSHDNPGQGTTIKWAGAAGSPMFRVRDVGHLTIEGIHFLGDDQNPPSEAIYFESVTGDNAGTNEQVVVRDCRFGYLAWATDSDMTRCIRFGGENANNDQFYIARCIFHSPLEHCVKIEQTQSIWGSFEDCTFQGADRAIGLETVASVQLRNPQFNRCTTDIKITNTAKVLVFGHNSENSGLPVDCTAAGACYFGHGGMVLLSHFTADDPFIRHTACGTSARISLRDMTFPTNGSGHTPQVYIRGTSSTTRGALFVDNCGIGDNQYDVQAGTGDGGVLVDIRDVYVSHRSVLTAEAALSLS